MLNFSNYQQKFNLKFLKGGFNPLKMATFLCPVYFSIFLTTRHFFLDTRASLLTYGGSPFSTTVNTDDIQSANRPDSQSVRILGQPYHIVDPSPWPVLVSLALLSNVLWVICWLFYLARFEFVFFALFIVLFSLAGWWFDVHHESTYQGQHTSYVIRGLRIGMVLFIVSEIFFFLAFFWAYLHNALNPSIFIGGVWPPARLIPLTMSEEDLLAFAEPSKAYNQYIYRPIGSKELEEWYRVLAYQKVDVEAQVVWNIPWSIFSDWFNDHHPAGTAVSESWHLFFPGLVDYIVTTVNEPENWLAPVLTQPMSYTLSMIHGEENFNWTNAGQGFFFPFKLVDMFITKELVMEDFLADVVESLYPGTAEELTFVPFWLKNDIGCLPNEAIMMSYMQNFLQIMNAKQATVEELDNICYAFTLAMTWFGIAIKAGGLDHDEQAASDVFNLFFSHIEWLTLIRHMVVDFVLAQELWQCWDTVPYDATYENRDSRQQFYPDSFSPDILFDSFITYLKNNDNLVFAAYFEELRASLIMLDKNYRSYFLPVVDPGVEVIFPQFLFIFQLPPFLQMRLFAQIPYHIADNWFRIILPSTLLMWDAETRMENYYKLFITIMPDFLKKATNTTFPEIAVYAIQSSWNPWRMPAAMTLLLICSGLTLTASHIAICVKYGSLAAALRPLCATLALALIFLVLQAFEYVNLPISINDGIFGSVFFMATGFHGFHVLVGAIFLTVCLIRMYQGFFASDSHVSFECAIWYWHFVDVVWIFLFVIMYWWAQPEPEIHYKFLDPKDMPLPPPGENPDVAAMVKKYNRCARQGEL